nr:unnamed protein product [Digitaria exilis]
MQASRAKKADAAALPLGSSVFKHADAVDVALMVLGFVGAVGDGMVTPLRLLIASRIANDLGTGPDHIDQFTSKINANVISIVFIACAAWVMAFLEGYCWARTAERQASRMRARYLQAVLRQDVEYFDVSSVSTTSEVVTSVTNDSLAVQDALAEKVPSFIMYVTTFFGCYAVGFVLLWRLTLVTLPSALLLIVPGVAYGRALTDLARRIRVQYARPGAVAEQAVSSARTVYAFAAENATMARFAAALEDSSRLGLRQGLAKGVAMGSNGVAFAIYAFNIWYGGRLVMYHGYQGGTVFVVSSLIVIGGVSLGSALSNVKYFSEATAAADRILEMTRRVPKIDSESCDGEEVSDVAGEVEFRSVVFCYPSRPESPVLVGFSLRVPAGHTVALVGHSGSGKSTTIALLERFYDPTAGEVVMDGVDIRRLRLKWLRAQMGLVSQEPAMFAMSVRENILFGEEDATGEEVIAAAKAANAHDFISQLPQGYDTQMSGGQKQRIAIARAILRSPKILLLDEATSALDTESERIVQEALDVASKGRTTIVVAHRLSTIRNADSIAVVQSGAVQELGSHGELMAKNGMYSSLVHLQQTRDSSEGNGAGGGTCRTSPTAEQCSNTSKILLSSSASRSNTNRTLSMGDAGDGDSNDKPKIPVPSLGRMLLLNAPEWKHALIGGLSAVLSGGIHPVYAYGMGCSFSIYYSKDHDEIKEKTRLYALVFLALVVLSFLLSIGQHYSFGAMGEYLTKRIRERMLAKILTFEIGWFDQDENSSGAICSQLARDANITGSMVLIAFTVGLVISWRLALVMIVMQPFIIACSYARRVLLKRMSTKSVQAQSETSKIAADALSNLRTITAFSSQDRILRLFSQAQDGPYREGMRQAWFAGLGLGTSVSLTIFSWALNYWYSGKLMAERLVTVDAVFQTTMILVSTGRVIADACSMTTDIAKGADAVSSVFAILDRQTKIEPKNPDGFKPEKLTGDVEIVDVDFAYPSRPDVVIFKGFSLSIMAGKSTALVGQSGSGKSTIIGLIERFYDPINGTVSIDGRDIRSYNLQALRRRIGLVSQEPTLFAGTIRENIMLGEGTASEAEVEDAARAANAHGFIAGLKDGYETWCGDRGAQLSGGQKQRVAIARAILKNPAILLLDEATSALDGRSEKAVQEALDRVMVGRTSVVVAHRLSTIQNCDAIAVLERGVVVEKGTHESPDGQRPVWGQGGKQH